MRTIAKIRRAYLVEGKSIKAIRRELRVSRKVVRKMLRSGAIEFHYERSEQPMSRIGPCKERVDRLLAENEAKPDQERLALIRLFEQLRGMGYEGGYDAVRRYARSWRREHAAASSEAYGPLSFAPGEAYRFDWSHEVVLIGGAAVTVKVAQLRLCYSRMPFGRLPARRHPGGRRGRSRGQVGSSAALLPDQGRAANRLI
jgi:transposase